MKGKTRSLWIFFLLLAAYGMLGLFVGLKMYGLFQRKSDALGKLRDSAGGEECFGIIILIILLMIVFTPSYSRRTKEIPARKAFETEYKAIVQRKKPNVNTEEAYRSIKRGGIGGIITLFFGFFLAVGSLLEGTKNIDPALICISLFFAPVLVLQGGLCITLILDGIPVLVSKRNWMKGTASAQAIIVDRKVVSEVDYYGDRSYTYEFVLKIDTIQETTSLDQQCVGASVSERIYNKYAHSDTARVYYSVASPLTFLIDGE